MFRSWFKINKSLIFLMPKSGCAYSTKGPYGTLRWFWLSKQGQGSILHFIDHPIQSLNWIMVQGSNWFWMKAGRHIWHEADFNIYNKSMSGLVHLSHSTPTFDVDVVVDVSTVWKVPIISHHSRARLSQQRMRCEWCDSSY